MAKLFRKVLGIKKPKPPPAPKVPTAAEVAKETREAAEVEKQRAFSQRGRAATMLSRGAQGDDTSGLATKKLLGGS